MINASATSARHRLPAADPHLPPFLNWPVSRREIYRTILYAMLPAIAWGLLIYGVRALIMLGVSLLAATFMHLLLKHWLKWKRAGCLLSEHTLLSALVLVALARPAWPAWIVAAAALLLPLIYVVVGGPGRERVHIALSAALIIQYVMLPLLTGHTYAGKSDAILARDRLFMGDIRDQHAPVGGAVANATVRWPASRELAGDDAYPALPPAVVAADTLNQVSAVLVTRPIGPSAPLSTLQLDDIGAILQRAFAYDLPSMDLVMAGINPNRVGGASLIAIAIAGLFLAYRYVLRPRSVLLFLAVYIAGTIAFTFTPHVIHVAGFWPVGQIISKFPGEIISLVEYLLFNGDAAFAAVFILSLPGTVPLTSRGRLIFLPLAAILAAGLHRLDPVAPAATLILCLFTPLARTFDTFLAPRSWLSA